MCLRPQPPALDRVDGLPTLGKPEGVSATGRRSTLDADEAEQRDLPPRKTAGAGAHAKVLEVNEPDLGDTVVACDLALDQFRAAPVKYLIGR
jgi:hypothetical protein